MSSRILIIRLGALGDIVLCFAAFQAIRRAHPEAEIALLTMPAFAAFARSLPWFDKVIVDPRPPSWRLDKWWSLGRDVRAFAPTRVYDLQGKFRQTILFHLLGKPEWSGAAKGCSHPRLWPPVAGMHYTDFVVAQLERAGINMNRHSRAGGNPISFAQPLEGRTWDPRLRGDDEIELDWLTAPLDAFTLPEKFALLIPGCAPNRPYKRWPPAHYAELAKELAERGIQCVAIGTTHDTPAIREIIAAGGPVIDLSGQTSLPQVAALARKADYVIGNDTGPTHLAAAVGARTLALMSDRVNPHWSAPKGPRATWVQGKPLETLSPESVLAALV